jgi:hypothetical protein
MRHDRNDMRVRSLPQVAFVTALSQNPVRGKALRRNVRV